MFQIFSTKYGQFQPNIQIFDHSAIGLVRDKIPLFGVIRLKKKVLWWNVGWFDTHDLKEIDLKLCFSPKKIFLKAVTYLIYAKKCQSYLFKYRDHIQIFWLNKVSIKYLTIWLFDTTLLVKSEGAEYVYSHYHCSCRTLLYFTCSNNLFMEVPIFLDICSRSLLNGPRLLQYNLYAWKH